MKAVDMDAVRLSNQAMRKAKESEQEPRQVYAAPGVRNLSDAFFDGFTVAGLFTRLQEPGSPRRLFADEEPVTPAAKNVGATTRLQARALKVGAFGLSRRTRNARPQDSVVPDVHATSIPTQS